VSLYIGDWWELNIESLISYQQSTGKPEEGRYREPLFKTFSAKVSIRRQIRTHGAANNESLM
jgi:hypothetical protein